MFSFGPKISIITVNYNNGPGLQRTIESVLSQNYTDVEFIVIDGDSNDSSKTVINKYASKIDKKVSEKDKGIYNAMNKGVLMAEGEYLLFLNSGDHFIKSTTLNEMATYINTEDIICFNIQVKEQNKEYIKSHPQNITFSFLYTDTLAHQSTFIKKDLFNKVGLYDETLKIVSDWKFFVKALVQYNCSYRSISKTLTRYYLDGISATSEGTFIRRDERKGILEKEFSLFDNDYKRMELLKSNRFKILIELENSKISKKAISLWLRILLKVFRNKNVKDI